MERSNNVFSEGDNKTTNYSKHFKSAGILPSIIITIKIQSKHIIHHCTEIHSNPKAKWI